MRVHIEVRGSQERRCAAPRRHFGVLPSAGGAAAAARSASWLWWLAAAALPLAAAAPLFGPGLVATHRYGDSPFLLVRVVALIDALRAGTLFPRWSPELAYGLGYPLFDFYAALSFYVAAGLHVVGLPIIDAIKLTQALGLLGASLAMFALARRHLGNPGGLVAAASYGYAPYHLVNVYARGDSLGEFTALALLPALLLAIEVAATGRAGGALAVAVLVAALVWTHNLSALLAAPLLLGWAALALVRRWRRERRLPLDGLVALALGAGLGAGLSAFYWLPALMDRRYVHFEHNTTGYFDFRNHFLGWRRLMQITPIYDYGLGGTPGGALPFQLGLVQTAAALIGLACLPLLVRRVGRSIALAGAAAGLSYTALATPLARPVWEALPPLQIAQFPWRALGPAALGLALLAALPALSLRGRVCAVWAVAAVFGLALAGGLGANPERWRIAPEEVDAAGVQRYEYLTSSIGSTVRYEYLPLAARERPWTSSYVTLPASDGLRLLPGQPASVRTLEARGASFTLDVGALSAGPMTFEHYWFPGWRARVDGQEVPTRPSDPEGYLTIDVPAGQHQVALWFGETRLRAFADWASLTSLAAFLAVAGWWVVRRHPDPFPQAEEVPASALARGVPLVVAVASLALLLIRVPWTDLNRVVPADGLDHRFGHEHAPWAFVVPDGVDLDGWRVQGYRQPTVVAAGEPARVDLALAGAGGDLRARLVSPAEAIVQAPRAVAETVQAVAPGTVELSLFVPLATPPGLYEVELSDPGVSGPRWFLAPLRVERSASKGPVTPLASFGDQIALDAVAPTDDATATRPSFALDWRAVGLPADDWRVSARLVDQAGHVWASSDGRPDDGFYPTRLWRPGDLVAERRDLVPLSGTPPGRYRLDLRLYSLAGQALDVLDLRGAAIAPNYRSEPFVLPTGPAPIAPNATGPPLLVESTLGANDVVAGATVPLLLLWQVGAPPGRDLDVVLSLDGVAQRAPAGGQYRAGAWRAGELVRDQIDLRVPPRLAAGEYPLSVGLLDASSGQPFTEPGEIGRLRVQNRPRSFDLPPLEHAVGARFGDAIELAGYALDKATVRPGGAVRLTLYWRALSDMATSYTVFTHLLDADQRVRGQVDAVPGGGALPTNGWAAGEVIQDHYTIPLDSGAAPGRYELEVGLYDARSGARLPVAAGPGAGGDHVVLTAIDVGR